MSENIRDMMDGCPFCARQPIAKLFEDGAIAVWCGNKDCPLKSIEFCASAWNRRTIDEAGVERVVILVSVWDGTPVDGDARKMAREIVQAYLGKERGS